MRVTSGAVNSRSTTMLIAAGPPQAAMCAAASRSCRCPTTTPRRRSRGGTRRGSSTSAQIGSRPSALSATPSSCHSDIPWRSGATCTASAIQRRVVEVDAAASSRRGPRRSRTDRRARGAGRRPSRRPVDLATDDERTTGHVPVVGISRSVDAADGEGGGPAGSHGISLVCSGDRWSSTSGEGTCVNSRGVLK